MQISLPIAEISLNILLVVGLGPAVTRNVHQSIGVR